MTPDAILQELDATRARLRERESELRTERERLAAAQAEIARLLAENADLRHRVDRMARRMFGQSSERLTQGQLLLAFEAAREEEARRVEEDRLETALGEETPATPRRRRPSQKKAHANLPVREVHVEPPEADRLCGCGEARCRIGEEVSEQLDYVPASLHVVRTIRGKFACPRCQEGVVVAPLPPQGIERSVAAPGLVAHVVASKYADHLPLYRQEEIFARAGVDLPRSTLGDLVAQAAVRLAPVARAVLAAVLAGRVVHTDDTPVTYLLQPRGRATGAVWVYVGERGEAAYDFTETRSRDGPAAILASYRGFLQADALKVYDAIYAMGDIVEVACWAHVRRYFFDALGSERERATEMLGKIRRLYAVEARARSLDEPDRVVMRLEHAKPVLGEIRAWLDRVAPTTLPKGPLGQAIAYATANWAALQRYLEHGFLDIDNNEAERALRGVAVGRKNWLFAGSAEAGRRAAVLMTLVATCKLQGVDPEAYLADVLVRVNTTPLSRLGELTPRGWKKAREAALPDAPRG
ncbi:MAG TPA: IS66 family transposase [Candidatus Limnocylindrales bacterium]|nr:IS66 family transposase [Candidatus Limnocylindrales bacterium]